MSTTTHVTLPESDALFREPRVRPVLMVAFSPPGTVTTDRVFIDALCLAGRSTACHLRLRDGKISRRHFHVTQMDDACWIEDLGSTNGTFVNGERLTRNTRLSDGAVIRAGQSVLVFTTNSHHLCDGPYADQHGIAGRFYAASIIRSIEQAVNSVRHVLLHGPSGTGKELAAALVSRWVAPKGPTINHNAAAFATEEEGATSLFGVEANVFSGVHYRKGLIEEAEGGVLFLDETHNLPPRLQKSLLRVIETGDTKRIGNNRSMRAKVRFVFASNATGKSAGLVHDLYARMHVVRIPSLNERRADIPSIFLSVLNDTGQKHGVNLDTVIRHLTADHFETLCLARYDTENVRGLIDLADRIAANLTSKTPLPLALNQLFTERFHDNPVSARHRIVGHQSPTDERCSVYEQYKELIVTAYQRCEGNISAVERMLKKNGIACSRRWLTHYVRAWGLRR